jgi:hypothetical protein
MLIVVLSTGAVIRTIGGLSLLALGPTPSSGWFGSSKSDWVVLVGVIGMAAGAAMGAILWTGAYVLSRLLPRSSGYIVGPLASGITLALTWLAYATTSYSTLRVVHTCAEAILLPYPAWWVSVLSFGLTGSLLSWWLARGQPN